MSTPPAPTGGHLLHNLLLFGRILRRLGLDVHAGRMTEVVGALELVGVSRKRDFRQTLRTMLVHRQQDLAPFDEAFEVFWRRHADEWTTMDLRSLGETRRFRQPQVGPPPAREPAIDGVHEGADPQDVDHIDLSRSYSAREVLRVKDFARFTPEEVAQAKQMMAGLVWDVGQRRTRRWHPGWGQALDLRRAVRANLQYGGELVRLPRRRQVVKQRPLVLLCDVSGSMERYTRMLLHFVYCLAGGLDRVEVFLFATRLTRVTRHLRHRGVDDAVKEVARSVPDWAGGTRIGEAVKAFNFRWARRVLGGGSVVLVVSDGWDRGEPEVLDREMARLQRSCHRLVWLNPLLGSPDYEPLTRGMCAALPYLDDFLPVHNLSSLEDLARYLNTLSSGRPARRQPKAQAAVVVEDPARAARTLPPPPPPATGGPTFRHPLWGRGRA